MCVVIGVYGFVCEIYYGRMIVVDIVVGIGVEVLDGVGEGIGYVGKCSLVWCDVYVMLLFIWMRVVYIVMLLVW